MRRHVVDNRVLLLGLDFIYRETIKHHESRELLECARRVAATLEVAPADVPIEGYYTEGPQLTEYFRLVRALQTLDADLETKVAALPEFERLRSVTSARLFGTPSAHDKLFPAARDPLYVALERTPIEQWTVPALTAKVGEVVTASDDYSLVGLACRAGDSVVIAALRESVVLYADVVEGAFALAEPVEFAWEVDPELARHARRFVDEFNTLFPTTPLPLPVPEEAAAFWGASENDVAGRCVRIGRESPEPNALNYHWAIDPRGDDYSVRDFWSKELWTTERYRAEGAPRGGPPRTTALH